MNAEEDNGGKLIPGTTSKILWHFTGGPKIINAETGERDTKPKDKDEAYRYLESIVETGFLRAGKEYVKYRINDEVGVKVLVIVHCCYVAEIPIQHLQYHAQRYGKFALGFHRDNLRGSHRFRPVHYAFNHDDWVAIDAWKLLSFLDHVTPQDQATTEMKSAADRHLAFIKTFSDEESGTVYCEREWRAVDKRVEKDIQVFKDDKDGFFFKPEDLCFLVCPRTYAITRLVPRIRGSKDLAQMYAHVPVVPFEDLVEH